MLKKLRFAFFDGLKIACCVYRSRTTTLAVRTNTIIAANSRETTGCNISFDKIIYLPQIYQTLSSVHCQPLDSYADLRSLLME